MTGLAAEAPADPAPPYRQFALAAAIGLGAAMLFSWLNSPLPWLIGPLLVIAGCRLAGLGLWCPVSVRWMGQWVIGAALGLYFTPDVVSSLQRLWWAVLVGIVFAWLLSLGFALLLRRVGGLDPASAFFAGAIGGASEMAVQGERAGARVELIAAVHSVRVLIVVVSLPYLYRLLDLHGSDRYVPARLDVQAPALLGFIAATVFIAWLLSRWRLPNAWVLCPLVVGGLLTAQGASPSALPGWMIGLGQIAIGIALGVRFQPESMRQIRRILPLVVAMTAAGIAVSAGFGAMMAKLLGIPVATMILATSPGGIAEMSLTAKVLQFGVPVVTVFHVTRMIGMVVSAGSVYRCLSRWLGWPRITPDGRVV
ncbi:MAG: AbrB family transcriptional regulator [Burkholderiaceae bacterium]